MSTKERIICPHYGRVLLQRNLPKIQEAISKLQALHKKQRIKCELCHAKLETPNLCLKCQASICDLEKSCLFDHTKNTNNDHCIIINIQTTSIICLLCKVEILDFEQYGLTGNEEVFNQWINPQRIRIEYNRYFYKQGITHLKVGIQHVGILNIANSSFINSVLQVILNFPTIQLIFQRINTEYENYNQAPKSKKKNCLRQLCFISETFRQKTNKIINPTEFLKTIAMLDPQSLGYGRKEAYDFFKFIINFIHEEFRFSNLKAYSKCDPFQNEKPSLHDWDIMYEQQQYLDRSQSQLYRDYSFIQSMFSGELKTTTECQNCKTVQVLTENYSAISLEIPEIKKEGFLKKLVDGLKTSISLEKDPVTLMECLEFFYEPIMDNLNYCSCGVGKGSKRFYRFNDQSNLLCIHIQRFQNKQIKDTTHVSFPIDPTNFSQYFDVKGEYNYQLYAIIVHYQCVAGDHFETILRQQNNTFISIKDEVIQQVSLKYVKESQAHLLFYTKIQNKINQSTIHNLITNKKLIESGEIKLKNEDLCYLPNFWYEQFITLAIPPMIMTSHLICVHGNLKPDYWDFRSSETYSQTNLNQSFDVNASFTNQFSLINSSAYEQNSFFASQIDEKQESIQQQQQQQQQSQAQAQAQASSSYLSLQLNSTEFPKEIARFLFEKFGGGPILPKNIQTCQICIEAAQLMSRRRKFERQLISKYENYSTIRCKVIDENWIKGWQKYLYHSKIQLQKNNIFGIMPPGEIKNEILLDQQQQMLRTQKEGISYRVITKPIWKVLQNLYGGGPEITFVENHEVFRLDQDDLLLIQELKGMLLQCKQISKQFEICREINT